MTTIKEWNFNEMCSWCRRKPAVIWYRIDLGSIDSLYFCFDCAEEITRAILQDLMVMRGHDRRKVIDFIYRRGGWDKILELHERRPTRQPHAHFSGLAISDRCETFTLKQKSGGVGNGAR